MGREANEADTLQRILNEAAALFVVRGYQGVSMREIGDAVGITKAALYYHFKDKEDLFMALLRASLEEIGRVMDEAEQGDAATVRGGASARQRIELAVRGLLALPADRRALIRVASQEMVHVNAEVRAAFGQVYQVKFIGRIARMLQEGMAAGELRPMDAQLATWFLLGMAYPFFTPNQTVDAMSEVATELLRVFFEGLGEIKLE